MLDSFLFERRGIPATALITDEFIPGAKAVITLHGVPDYPFVLVPHPLAGIASNELEDRANLAVPQFEKILTKF